MHNAVYNSYAHNTTKLLNKGVCTEGCCDYSAVSRQMLTLRSSTVVSECSTLRMTSQKL